MPKVKYHMHFEFDTVEPVSCKGEAEGSTLSSILGKLARREVKAHPGLNWKSICLSVERLGGAVKEPEG